MSQLSSSRLRTVHNDCVRGNSSIRNDLSILFARKAFLMKYSESKLCGDFLGGRSHSGQSANSSVVAAKKGLWPVSSINSSCSSMWSNLIISKWLSFVVQFSIKVVPAIWASG